MDLDWQAQFAETNRVPHAVEHHADEGRGQHSAEWEVHGLLVVQNYAVHRPIVADRHLLVVDLARGERAREVSLL